MKTLINEETGLVAPMSFPLIRVEHNHGTRTLKNATWYPYADDADGSLTNGYLEGELIDGSITNRLFQYTCTKDEKRGQMRQDYIRLGYVHDADPVAEGAWGHDRVPTINIQTCG